jgi:predicted enzyme related to lactoylglutathione lyase
MKNALSWFEIFVNELDRACAFYERVLGIRLRREDFLGQPMAIFPQEEGGVGGALVRDAGNPVGAGGTMVYLDATGKLDACLDRVPGAGGVVVRPRTSIGRAGFIALVRDSEGNTVGLHSEA